MNDDQKKTKVGWYVRNEKLDRLAEIKRIKNNQLEMSGSPELKDVEIVEMALDDLYYKVMSKSKDKDTNERLSNMIDNKVNVSYENIEMMNVNIQRQLLKDHKLLDLMVSLVLPNMVEKMANLSADKFNGDVNKANDYIYNEYLPNILKNESRFSQMVEEHVFSLNNDDVDKDNEIQ